MSLYARFSALLDGVLDELAADGALPADASRKAVAVEPPRVKSDVELDCLVETYVADDDYMTVRM